MSWGVLDGMGEIRGGTTQLK